MEREERTSIKQAVDEALKTPFYEMIGLFSGSILLCATENCPGKAQRLSQPVFDQTRRGLLSLYQDKTGNCLCSGYHTPTQQATLSARKDLQER